MKFSVKSFTLNDTEKKVCEKEILEHPIMIYDHYHEYWRLRKYDTLSDSDRPTHRPQQFYNNAASPNRQVISFSIHRLKKIKHEKYADKKQTRKKDLVIFKF